MYTNWIHFIKKLNLSKVTFKLVNKNEDNRLK